MTLENGMGPVLPKGQSQYVHISETCARVAVPAAQHMMCQLLYIGWVRKRLIKDKLYSSPCNISASLSSFTEKKKKRRCWFKKKVTLDEDCNPERRASITVSATLDKVYH